MREILFKAKRLDTGEWIDGNYCLAERLDGSGYETLIIEVSKDGMSFEVDPSTICQFTGLTDKNGRKIFEGDIIQKDWLGYNHTYCVNYCIDIVSFIGICKDSCGGFTTFDGSGDFEIIGNIHDKDDDNI